MGRPLAFALSLSFSLSLSCFLLWNRTSGRALRHLRVPVPSSHLPESQFTSLLLILSLLLFSLSRTRDSAREKQREKERSLTPCSKTAQRFFYLSLSLSRFFIHRECTRLCVRVRGNVYNQRAVFAGVQKKLRYTARKGKGKHLRRSEWSSLSLSLSLSYAASHQ